MRRINKLTQGDSASRNWRTVNDLIDIVRWLQDRVGKNTSDIRERRTRPRDMEAGADGSTQRYQIVTIYNDRVACKTWDGTTLGSTTVQIALPFKLRKLTGTETIDGDEITYTNGGSQRRTATGDAGGEVQAIVPRYLVDDEIYADKPNGGTGVTVSTVDLVWMDTNRDARAWAREYE